MAVPQLNIQIKNFPYICRICLHSDDIKPEESDINLSEKIHMLKHLTGIEITEDNKLPKNICNNCAKQLDEIDVFIKFCKANDEYLKALILLDENKEPVHESDDPSCDNFADEESYDEIDNMALSEREIKTEKWAPKNANRGLKSRKRTKKRIENCDCQVCGKKFTRRGGLKRHSKIHLGIKPFECETCGKTFVEKATLNRHYLIHTGEKPFECNLCGKTTTRKDQVLEHISKHHPNAVNCDFIITEHKRSEIYKRDIAEIKSDPQLNHSHCDKRVKVEENCDEAVKSSFETNEDDTSNDDLKKLKTKKRIEICLCNLCGKVFRRRGYLKNHMAIHAKIKPFQCNVCGKGFTQRHALTRHNLVHTKERPFQCNLCGKTFTRKEILMDHLKNHEEGSKPYLCFHCGKCFSSKDYLSKHLKYYLPGNGKKKGNSDEKKCICPQCGKQLHSVSYLKTHLLTHTGEKPYECNICGNRFTVLRSLNHHLNIHKGVKPYQCTQCEKAFRTSGSLRKHVLLHTGERPFKCTSCEKGFIRRSHLKRHLRIH